MSMSKKLGQESYLTNKIFSKFSNDPMNLSPNGVIFSTWISPNSLSLEHLLNSWHIESL